MQFLIHITGGAVSTLRRHRRETEGPGKLKLLHFNVSLQKEIGTPLADRALRVSYLDISGFQMALICRKVVVPQRQQAEAGIEPAPCGSHRHIPLSPMTGFFQPVDQHMNSSDKMVTFSSETRRSSIMTSQPVKPVGQPVILGSAGSAGLCGSGVHQVVGWSRLWGETTLSTAPVHHTETLLLCRRRLLSDRAEVVVQPLYLPPKERLNRSLTEVKTEGTNALKCAFDTFNRVNMTNTFDHLRCVLLPPPEPSGSPELRHVLSYLCVWT